MNYRLYNITTSRVAIKIWFSESTDKLLVDKTPPREILLTHVAFVLYTFTMSLLKLAR